MKKSLLLALMAIGGTLRLCAGVDGCYSVMRGDTLLIGNSRIERAFRWNDGHLATLWVSDKASGKRMVSSGKHPDFTVNRHKPSAGTVSVTDLPADDIRPARQVTTVSYRLGDLEVRRSYTVYAATPAITCSTELRGSLSGSQAQGDVSAADRKNIEHVDDMNSRPVTAVLDRLTPGGNHWHGKAVEFRDITDWNNNLVEESDFISYRKTNHRGNLLFVTDGEHDGGFIFVKEAPCSSVQLAYRNADFISDFGDFMVTGLGVSDSDVTPDKWTTAYTVAVCTFGNGELSALESLRSYRKQDRRLLADRDEMVMMNTWGDRSQDAKVNEAFCLAELERAARLGITLFQIDDGWQAGKSPNSAVAKGSFTDIWRNNGYWTPDSVKYPRGLTPIVERGRELGIEIGLWFNPSIQNDFADWEKDAATITGLYRRYGIRMFKIDGLTIATKRAEENLRRLFDRVLADTDNAVMFNLDATASRRGGYHMFSEYGNIFLENRYTDWGNYYPYHTLRNLWQLSRYVPAERLQIEFLNKWRNADKYEGDTFAPSTYGFDYIFATTMAGQPLAWMEASNLPDEAFDIAPLVRGYREVMHEFHSGTILPVGDEPSGRSWTGFQSITSPDEGFLLVYRELTPGDTGVIDTWLPEGKTVRLTPVLGDGAGSTVDVSHKGRINITLPRTNDYTLYRYKIN